MSFRRSLAASLIGRYLGLAVGIATTIVLARVLTPAEYGLFGIAFAFMAAAAGLRHFGAVEYLVQTPTLQRADQGRAFALTMCIALVFAGSVWLAREQIATFYGLPRLAYLLSLLAVNFLLSPFGIGAIAELQREYAFATLQTVQLVAGLCGAVTSVVLAVYTHDASSLAYGQIVMTVVYTGALAAIRPRAVFCLPVLTGWGRMFKFGIFRGATTLVLSGSMYAVPLIIGRSLGAVAVGFYDRAYGVQHRVAGDMAGTALRVVFVAIAKAKDDIPKLSAFALVSLGNLTAIVWPLLGLLAVLAEPTIVLMFGDVWRPATPLLQALAVSGAVWQLSSIPFELMTARGETFRQFCIEVFNLGLTLGATAVLSRWGLVAVAWGTVGVAGVISAVRWLCIRHAMSVKLSAASAVLAKSLGLTLAAIVPSIVLLETGMTPVLGNFWLLAAGGTAGVVAWFAAAFLLRPPIYPELMLWLGRLVPRRSK